MTVFLNGRFVSEEQAMVSVFDRGFLYGDGLFETLTVSNGRLFRWQQHWERFESGARFLNISPPFQAEEIYRFVGELISLNKMPEALLRLTLSRGVGVRGYSPKGAEQPSLVMSLHPPPALDPDRMLQWNLITSTIRLPAKEPLAQFKTCNKLPQILARAEADATGAQEALLLNSDGFVVEASSSNFFWINGNTVRTPPLVSGILPGVTRAIVFEICRSCEFLVGENEINLEKLRRSDGVFLSLSSSGIVEAISLDGVPLRRSPLTDRIRRSYNELIRRESQQEAETASK
jgi:aminodeoxychorismate lyase